MHNSENISELSKILKEKILDIKSVAGGDIATSYLLETKSKKIFLKTHQNYNLLNAEQFGLNLIANTKTIATPKIIAFGKIDTITFLALDWIDTKTPNQTDYKLLAEQLAKLHQCTSSQFGLEHDNYIGSLEQSNKYHEYWLDFYIEERLLPQFLLAKNNNLLNQKEIPSIDTIKNSCASLFKNIKACLLHGDLWSGNYLISNDSIPFLIDPSVYYGHNEIDIAMSKLFGGFSSEFYDTYQKIFPTDKYFNSRIELYQLYYLLVHLNLFGESYYLRVKNLITKYF